MTEQVSATAGTPLRLFTGETDEATEPFQHGETMDETAHHSTTSEEQANAVGAVVSMITDDAAHLPQHTEPMDVTAMGSQPDQFISAYNGGELHTGKKFRTVTAAVDFVQGVAMRERKKLIEGMRSGQVRELICNDEKCEYFVKLRGNKHTGWSVSELGEPHSPACKSIGAPLPRYLTRLPEFRNIVARHQKLSDKKIAKLAQESTNLLVGESAAKRARAQVINNASAMGGITIRDNREVVQSNHTAIGCSSPPSSSTVSEQSISPRSVDHDMNGDIRHSLTNLQSTSDTPGSDDIEATQFAPIHPTRSELPPEKRSLNYASESPLDQNKRQRTVIDENLVPTDSDVTQLHWRHCGELFKLIRERLALYDEYYSDDVEYDGYSVRHIDGWSRRLSRQLSQRAIANMLRRPRPRTFDENDTEVDSLTSRLLDRVKAMPGMNDTLDTKLYLKAAVIEYGDPITVFEAPTSGPVVAHVYFQDKDRVGGVNVKTISVDEACDFIQALTDAEVVPSVLAIRRGPFGDDRFNAWRIDDTKHRIWRERHDDRCMQERARQIVQRCAEGWRAD